MSVSLCPCACFSVRDRIIGTARPIVAKFFLPRYLSYGRGSVLLWRRSDMLRTSGFMDDVTSARKPRLVDFAAQPSRSSHAALGLPINGA